MKVIFTNPYVNRVATEVMARQPVEYLKNIGINAKYVPEQFLDYDCDIIVFSKQCNIEIAKVAREKGIKTVWFADDGLFYHQTKSVLKDQEYLDAIISTCSEYTKFLKSLGFTNQNITIIHHHHCNFNNDVAKFNDEFSNVGYIGVVDQFHHPETIKNFANSLGLNVVVRDQKDIRYLDLDCGLAFIDKDYHDKSGLAEYLETSWQDRLNYRSNAKIVNHMSYGIPTIASNYSSYKEIASLAPDTALFCDSLEDVLQNIERLSKDKDLRKKMRDACLVHRDKFHLKNIIQDYKNLFETIL